MFILTFTDGVDVSSVGTPTDPTYKPVYLLLDSTNPEPDPSEPVELQLSLPVGNYCESARIYFRGTTASYWEITADDPSLANPVWDNSIVTSVEDGVKTSIWVRTSTIFEEKPVDDRSTSLLAEGDVRETL